MRPVTRLPLRRALYVCSNCRQEVIPRGVSPLSSQFRRHASSNSKSFLERAREKMWTEKPPGPEDPYSGESQLSRLATSAEDQGITERGTAQSSSEIDDPAPDMAGGDNYVQAETWDGLNTVGFLEEDAWKVHGPIRDVDEYEKFGHDVERRSLSDAAHQAVVEVCLMQLLGKNPATICDVTKHHESIQKMIDSCAIESSDSTAWSETLRFSDNTSMEALVFVFNQIGEVTLKEIETPGAFVQRRKTAGRKVVPEALRALSLADPTVKFAFVKRFAQLLGRRIPDYAITKSATVGELVTALSAQVKEKVPDVKETMKKHVIAGTMPPNLTFSKTRISRGDEDENYGRKKAIHAELYKRGLVLESKTSPAGLL